MSDHWYSDIVAKNGFHATSTNSQGSTSTADSQIFPGHDNAHKAALVSLPKYATAAGLDSSLLLQFLDHDNSVQEHAFPPTASANINPLLEQYYNQLVQALDLDTLAYAHVPADIMLQFKALLQQYPQAFYLPNSPLSCIKGFRHNIDTGNAPPVYRLPYHKSPAELKAIKEELERMLRLHIIEPSHSPWGAPCILVRKPLEKGNGTRS